MTPRAAAAVGLRVIAVWLLIEALISLVRLALMHRDFMAGMHRREYQPEPSGPAVSDYYLHDVYYIAGHSRPEVIEATVQIAGGLVLLLASKPFGALIARRLDNF